jgi:small-conductance mechanosensitive channel
MDFILAHWQFITWNAGIPAAVAVGALIAHSAVFSAAARLARRGRKTVDESFVRHAARPARLIFPALAVLLVSPSLRISPTLEEDLRHLLVLLLISGAAWFAAAMMNVAEDVLTDRYRMDVEDNLTARRIKTQVHVLRRIAAVMIALLALAAMLMTFPQIWNLGASLFASAGAAGLVVGMAGRSTLSNLLAGVQIALTEPIRLDDVVIVEGEWGRIEEICATYVVVRIWDLRRMVVPLSYFIERPFQNWTRTSASILGTVFLYVDYTVPVDELRGELHRILEASGMWDGKVWNLQVTNSTDRSIEIRALMSAPDSGRAWDLRCLVRERMVAYLQRNYPNSLPRIRGELERLPA